MQDRFVETKAGRIHLLMAGQGAPMLLLHSNGGSAYEFEHVIKPLAEFFTVYALDMLGQGDSDPLLRHMDVRGYASVVLEVMDRLGLERVVVSGASIGGAICVALGAMAPDRFSRIVVVECPFRTPMEWAANWERTEANYAPVVQGIDKIRPRFRSVDEALLTRWNIDRAKAGSKTCLSVMWALREYDMAADLARFPKGQVIVYGERGPTVARIDAFRAALPDARYHVLPDCGHFPMIDDPDAFIDILMQERAPEPVQEPTR